MVVGDIYVKQQTADTVTKVVQNVYVHENYDADLITNDIAVLQVNLVQ